MAYLSQVPGQLRVAIDGAQGTEPESLAASLIAPLQARGRPAVHVQAQSFWRDASLRLEYGHTDVHSLRHDWLDIASLQRELLVPFGAGAEYLPSLRDPVTNRSTREPRRLAQPGGVLLVSGQFLLGNELSFDRTVHLSASPATLQRITAADCAWTLPALQLYDEQIEPATIADIDVQLNDPRRPAVRGLSS